jgi:hypothetical protein
MDADGAGYSSFGALDRERIPRRNAVGFFRSSRELKRHCLHSTENPQIIPGIICRKLKCPKGTAKIRLDRALYSWAAMRPARSGQVEVST